jgi:hypothetical protein
MQPPLGITGFLGFVHCPILKKKVEKTTFRKLDLFPSSVKGDKTSTLLCPLEGANLNHRTTYVSLTTAKQIPETRLWPWEETGNMYKKSPRTHKFRVSYTIVTTLSNLFEITALLLS